MTQSDRPLPRPTVTEGKCLDTYLSLSPTQIIRVSAATFRAGRLCQLNVDWELASVPSTPYLAQALQMQQWQTSMHAALLLLWQILCHGNTINQYICVCLAFLFHYADSIIVLLF